MAKFMVYWIADARGMFLIDANSEEEAIKKFEDGNLSLIPDDFQEIEVFDVEEVM